MNLKFLNMPKRLLNIIWIMFLTTALYGQTTYLSVDDNTICLGHQSIFTCIQSYTSTWTINYGDGNTETGSNLTLNQQFIHTYAESGQYTFIFAGKNPEDNDTIIITVGNVDATIAGTNLLCASSCTGAIDLTVTEGIAPYTYNWTNAAETYSATTQDINNLCADTYYVTVTDQAGCTVTIGRIEIEVTQFAGSLIAGFVECEDNRIDYNAIFTNPATGNVYLWNFGDGNTSSNQGGSHNYATSGTYTVSLTVTNPAHPGCVYNDDISIEVMEVNPHVSSSNVCLGNPVSIFYEGYPVPNGVIYIDGITEYSGPFTASFEYEYTFTTIGQHQVIVEYHGDKCRDTILVNVSAISGTLTSINADCSSSCTGSINLTMTQGQPPYTYNWANADNSFNASTEDLTNLCPDTYFVTVTDANNCTYTNQVQIMSLMTGGAISVAIQQCDDNMIHYSISEANPTPGNLYQWNFGDGTTGTGLNGSHTYLSSGTYTVYVTITNPAYPGCEITDDRTVTVDEVNAYLSSNTICLSETLMIYYEGYPIIDGGYITIDGNAVVSNGSSNGYLEFPWQFTTLGTHTIVMGYRGCVFTMNVEVIDCCSLNVYSSIVNATCGATGSIALGVTGGEIPISYEWSNNATSSTISNLISNDYTVTVTDANNCTEVNTYTVSNSSLSASFVVTPSSCTLGCDGSATVAISDGLPPFTYHWSNGAATSSILEDHGTFTVSVSDAGACETVMTGTINNTAGIFLTLTPDETSCPTALDGNMDLTVTGGIPPYTYLWNGSQTTQDLSNIGVGDYSVTVTDHNGCSVTLSEHLGFSADNCCSWSVTSSITNDNCNSSGAIEVFASNGVAPYTYHWSVPGSASSITELDAGIYFVTVNDAGNCNAVLSFTVGSNASTLTANVSVTEPLCPDNCNGAINLTVSNGVPPYTYLWSNNAETEDLSNLCQGTYSVSVADQNGCPFNYTGIELQNQNESCCNFDGLEITTTDAACTCTGSASISINSGSGSYSYAWSSPGNSGSTASNLCAGVHTVTITDLTYNCSTIESFTIGNQSGLSVSFQEQTCTCGTNGSLTAIPSGGTAPYTYQWNLSGNTTSTLSQICGGYFPVTVTDAAGCVIRSGITSYPHILSLLVTSVVNATCDNECGGAANVGGVNGVQPYSYHWSTGATTHAVSGLCEGTYTVTVTDAANCSAVQTVVISKPPCPEPCENFAITIETVDPACYGQSTGQAMAVTAGGVGVEPFTFLWNHNQPSTQTINNLVPQSYTCTVTDGFGCTAVASGTVNPADYQYVSITGPLQFCAGGSVELTASGSSNVVWSDGSTGQSLIVSAEGTYTVSINNGCGVSDEVFVAQNGLPIFILQGEETELCNNAPIQLYTSIVSQNNFTGQFHWSPGNQTTPSITVTQAGTYTVSLTSNGCVSQATIVVTNNPNCEVNPSVLCDFQGVPPIPVTNNCLEEQFNNAAQNAHVAYSNYIEAQRDSFQQHYIQHCLNAYEDFKMEYTEKASKQYTLYYYDQAGNLIKTVPPAGIVLIDNPTDLQQIRTDRDQREKNLLTQHTMPTIYKYNSLNQLVYQDVPDHRRFDLFDFEPAGNGLAAGLNLTGTYFVDDQHAFITGSDGTNSVLYYSTDGGENWAPVSSVGIENLNDVTPLINNSAFAVGENGTCVKTADGGSTWNLIAPWAPTSDFFKVIFITENEGYVFQNDGKGWQTLDGGLTWTDYSLLLLNHTFTDIEYVNNAFYGVCNEGMFKYSVLNSAWQSLMLYVKAEDINFIDINMANSTYGFALGSNGRLFRKTTAGTLWEQLETKDRNLSASRIHCINQYYVLRFDQNQLFVNTNSNDFTSWHSVLSNVTSIYFMDAYNGYAICSGNTLKITHDGGFTWSVIQLSPSGLLVNASSLYVDNNLMVFGCNDKIQAYTIDNTSNVYPFLIEVLLNGVGNITQVTKSQNNYYILNSSNTAYQLNSNGTLSGVIYSNAISLANDNAEAYIATTNNGVIKASTGNSLNLAVNNLCSGTVYGAGANGVIYAITATSVIDHSNGIKTLPLKDICLTPTGEAFAVGDDATVLKTNNGMEWLMQSVNSAIDFKTVAAKSYTDYSAAGDIVSSTYNVYEKAGSTQTQNLVGSQPVVKSAIKGNDYYYMAGNGQMFKNNVAQPYLPATSAISTPGGISSDFSVGETGKIFANNISQWDLATGASAPVLTDAFVIPGTNTCYAVGGQQILESINGGQNWSQVGSSSSDLYCISFSDIDNGFAGGANGTLRKKDAINPGWGICTTTPPSFGNFNDIKAFSSNLAITAGSTGIYRTTDGNNFIQINSATNMNALYFVNTSLGYVVGDGGVVLKTNNGGDLWVNCNIPDPLDIMGVHFTSFDQGYVVCTNGEMYKTTDGGHTWVEVDITVATGNINSITFNGNSGYISGTQSTQIAFLDQGNLFSTRYWYDKVGKMVASQNTKQYKMDPPHYSYTKYDAMGRINEVGELESNTEPNVALINDLTFPNNWNICRTEVTQSIYDYAYNPFISALFGTQGQENLRNRVAGSMIFDTYQFGGTNNFNYAMYYSYDIHGNVKTLIYDLPELAVYNNQYKKLDYSFDLISGNVHQVVYQDGAPDMMIHKYEYDADNRITNVYTSSDGINWDQDAKYFYYAHGPLARAEIGQNKVQGTDYAYTLQGWMKGVNSETLNEDRDMGKDGKSDAGNINKYVAPDQYAYSLGYFAGDYSAINTPSNDWLAERGTSSALTADVSNLYNGNISSMVTSIRQFVQGNSNEIFANVYKYDQLNRLTKVRVYNDNDVISDNAWDNAALNNNYGENLSYDQNGNIMQLSRNGASGNATANFTGMDDLTYTYENADPLTGMPKHTNKLLSVQDATPSDPLLKDLKPGQSADNYAYDDIGNLIEDVQEDILEIEWTVYGKVKRIKRINGSDKYDLEFGYDPAGNRIRKTVIKPGTSTEFARTNNYYYLRDAQGNIMSTYSLMGTET
ncbi:MAG: hypothetical protein CVU05_02635, partial [Bacteroidetes bacterium HGW-Bacteroidetes-21]